MSGSDRVIATILRGGAASLEATAGLLAAGGGTRQLAAKERLYREGEQTGALSVLMSGVAQASRMLPSGAQQTVALFIPGDLLDLQALVLGRSSAMVSALTPAAILQIPRAKVRQLVDAQPEIAWGLWRRMAMEHGMLQEWLVGLGRRSAYAQAAHLLCELSTRMHAAGLSDGVTSAFPLTQVELGDVLGLSTVHVNRVLQQLRAEGLIEVGKGRLQIKDRTRLIAVSGFDPTYLEAEDQAAPWLSTFST